MSNCLANKALATFCGIDVSVGRLLLNGLQFLCKRLVYIEGVASAPWNRREIQRPPLLKGVGTALLKFARLRSVELGYEGRVGLHSLPEAERFYEKQGMLNFGEEEDYDYLVYFEYGSLRRKQTES